MADPNSSWMAGTPPGLMSTYGGSQTGGALGSIPHLPVFGGQQGQGAPAGQIMPAGYAPQPQSFGGGSPAGQIAPVGGQQAPGYGMPAGLLMPGAGGQQAPQQGYGGQPGWTPFGAQQPNLGALWSLIAGMGGGGGGFSMNGNAGQSALGQFGMGQFGNSPGGFSANGSAYR